MARSFDYSKWDKIELSDDESDVHPNIDKDSWFRMKHRSRLEREQKEDEEIKNMNQKNSEDQSRLNIINARLNGLNRGKNDDDVDAEFEDIDALNDEASELQTNIRRRNKKINEIQERRKWNIDNICKIKDEKTIVNSAEIVSLRADDFAPTGETEMQLARQREEDVSSAVPSATTSSSTSTISKSIPDTVASPKNSTPPSSTANSSSNFNSTATTPSTSTSSPNTTPSTSIPSPCTAPAATAVTKTVSTLAKSREKFAMMSYNDYALKHEAVLEEYSEIQDLEKTEKFVFKHCDVLLHEHAQSYMLLSCLEDEMNGKHNRMKLVCRQSQILSHITELGVQMRRDPRDVILPFFRRIEEKQYFVGFQQAVDDFTKRIIERAKVKRKEMDEAENKKGAGGRSKDVPLGPGGLNPYEVMESLPDALREAFESQSVEALKGVIMKMDPKDARYHMKRCVDAGLWVASDNSAFEDDDLEAGEASMSEGVDEDKNKAAK